MPDPTLSHRYQAAVLWPVTGTDRYGQPTLGDPVEIRCRWDDTRRDILDAQGMRVAIDATIYVDMDIDIGSEIYKGQLDDWLGTALGQDDNTDVMVVKTFNGTPDLRQRYTTRKIGLMKKSATRNPST